MHTYIHTYLHAYIHTYIHAYMHTYTHTYIHIHAHLQKNDLKWPKIKQVTNSKLHYIKFNMSISTILLNEAGLTQAKAGYTNYNF